MPHVLSQRHAGLLSVAIISRWDGTLIFEEKFTVDNIALQPTTLCNADCSYCYLRQTHTSKRMPPAVAEHLAKQLRSFTHPVKIVWHAGEPLATGIEHFRSLIRPFSGGYEAGMITHAVQTNATLITDDWCDLFIQEDVSIGVSLDGPPDLNEDRIDWAGKPMYDRIIAGITCLKRRGIPFTAIAVVTERALPYGAELFCFFSEIGCESVGFNIEETIGKYNSDAGTWSARVKQFWMDVYDAWSSNPSVSVREFDRCLTNMSRSIITDGNSSATLHDLFPSISYNGDVVLLSPEFIGEECAVYTDFTVGNIQEDPLLDILGRAAQVQYVRDFADGIEQCRKECGYFSVCFGGIASSKYFELGTLNGTSTAHCMNSEIMLTEALLEKLGENA